MVSTELDSALGVALDAVIAAMPTESQARIAEQTAQMMAKIEGLKVVRKLAQLTREQLGHGLAIKPSAVLKIEHQADLYLSTLRRFVETAGGTLEMRIELPDTGPLTLTCVGEIRNALTC